MTEQVIGAGDPDQGNFVRQLASGIWRFGFVLDASGAVANKSKETAFYFQDDWKVTPKLTINFGLRYEWSTPYTERNNLVQFSNFTGDTGIAVPINVQDPNTGTTLISHSGNLPGITDFPTSGRRNVPVDRNNWAPRAWLCLCVGFEHSPSRRCRYLLRTKRCNQLPKPRPGFWQFEPDSIY